jgi:hypothetical protein
MFGQLKNLYRLSKFTGELCVSFKINIILINEHIFVSNPPPPPAAGVATPERKHGSTRVRSVTSLRDVAHDSVLCTFSNRSTQHRGKWCGLSGQAAWTVHHVQNHTLPGYSPSAMQLGGLPCWASPLAFDLI